MPSGCRPVTRNNAMHSLITPHLVNPHTVDIIVCGADFVLMLCGGSGGDVEVLLDVVHVVEGGHGGEGAGAGGRRAALRLTLHTTCLDQS